VPSLIASYFVKQDAVNLTALVTPSFTPAIGEIIVVKGVTADANITYATPSDSQSNAYTLRKSSTTASFTPVSYVQHYLSNSNRGKRYWRRHC
jgi:hypothetical protein